MKVVLWVLGAFVVLVGGAFAFLIVKKPAMSPPSATKVEITAERLQRGKYLFEVVSSCEDCHSQRDMARFSGPVEPGTTGRGLVWPAELGLPGKVVSPNITPDVETGIGSWTDGEILRAFREGVSKDGRALFPFMPYTHLRAMSDEDAYSLVAYMRRMQPIKSKMTITELNFPVNLFTKFAPQPLSGAVQAPSKANRLEYGKYVATIAGCVICHTKMEKGEPIEGMEFAGGEEFTINPWFVRSANISPDPETGIGKWSEDKFVAKFKGYANLTFESAPKTVQANFTVMPWMAFSQLEEDDLRAIYTYLKSVKEVRHSVEVHPPVAPPKS
jgi:mono/diheme cytochrome c family protein